MFVSLRFQRLYITGFEVAILPKRCDVFSDVNSTPLPPPPPKKKTKKKTKKKKPKKTPKNKKKNKKKKKTKAKKNKKKNKNTEQNQPWSVLLFIFSLIFRQIQIQRTFLHYHKPVIFCEGLMVISTRNDATLPPSKEPHPFIDSEVTPSL